MGDLWRDLMRLINRMDMQEWALVLVGAIIVGFFCLRGFGSRSKY